MKEKIDERIKNIPNKIYLQVGDNVGWDVDFKELEDTGEVTWCSDKIENWDIEYIRASEFEHLVNQEVERRIAERMPSEEEIETQAIIKMQRDTKDGRIGILIDGTYADVFIDASEWLRSRLTNDSQKTEGGGE